MFDRIIQKNETERIIKIGDKQIKLLPKFPIEVVLYDPGQAVLKEGHKIDFWDDYSMIFESYKFTKNRK